MSEKLTDRLLSLADCDARAGEPLGKAMREAAGAIMSLSVTIEEQRKDLSTLRARVAEVEADAKAYAKKLSEVEWELNTMRAGRAPHPHRRGKT